MSATPTVKSLKLKKLPGGLNRTFTIWKVKLQSTRKTSVLPIVEVFVFWLNELSFLTTFFLISADRRNKCVQRSTSRSESQVTAKTILLIW